MFLNFNSIKQTIMKFYPRPTIITNIHIHIISFKVQNYVFVQSIHIYLYTQHTIAIIATLIADDPNIAQIIIRMPLFP